MSSTKLSASTVAITKGQTPGDKRREVDVGGGDAAHIRGHTVAPGGRRQHGVPQVVHEVDRLGVRRPCGGGDGEHRRGARPVHARRRHGDDALGGFERIAQAHHARIGGPRPPAGRDEHPREVRFEGLGRRRLPLEPSLLAPESHRRLLQRSALAGQNGALGREPRALRGQQCSLALQRRALGGENTRLGLQGGTHFHQDRAPRCTATTCACTCSTCPASVASSPCNCATTAGSVATLSSCSAPPRSASAAQRPGRPGPGPWREAPLRGDQARLTGEQRRLLALQHRALRQQGGLACLQSRALRREAALLGGEHGPPPLEHRRLTCGGLGTAPQLAGEGLSLVIVTRVGGAGVSRRVELSGDEKRSVGPGAKPGGIWTGRRRAADSATWA